VLLDNSRSMGFGSTEVTKADYARTLAATLAFFLDQQRDAAGLLIFDEAVADWLPARRRPGHLRRMLMALERAPAGRSTDLAMPLERIAQWASRRGMIVLISDLLAPVESLRWQLSALRARQHEVIVFRVLDPTELGFDFREPAMFFDMESGRELYIDPAAAKAMYQERFGEHHRSVEELAASLGIDLFVAATDRPLELALFDYLAARQRRGRQALRRQYLRAPGTGGAA
jgi:uncharacterized protein (DUF58 family)